MELTILGHTLRVEVLVLIAVVAGLLGCHLLCSCSRVSVKEGLQVLSPSDVGSGKPTVTSESWAAPYLSGDTKKNNSVGAHAGEVPPLPEGQLDMFADNAFTPGCCNSSLSSSTGCACVTSAQVEYINTRGGNRTCGCGTF